MMTANHQPHLLPENNANPTRTLSIPPSRTNAPKARIPIPSGWVIGRDIAPPAISNAPPIAINIPLNIINIANKLSKIGLL